MMIRLARLLSRGQEKAGNQAKKPTTTQPGQKGKGALSGLQEKLTSGVTKAGQAIGVVEKPRTIEDEMCEMCPKLTMKQRLAGFCGACLSLFPCAPLVE